MTEVKTMKTHKKPAAVFMKFRTMPIHFVPKSKMEDSRRLTKSYTDKIKELADAVNDPCFMDDIAEITEDFKLLDNQYEL